MSIAPRRVLGLVARESPQGVRRLIVRRVAAFVFLLGACQAENWFVPPPPLSGTTALALRQDEYARLWIFSEWPTVPLRLELQADASVELWGVVYDEGSAEISSLPLGEIELSTEGPLTRRLPTTGPIAQVYSISESGEWTPRPEGAVAFEGLYFRDQRVCPSFEIEEIFVELPEPTLGFYFTASLGERSAAFATPEGEFFHLDADKRLTSVEVRGLEGELSALSGYEGELWLGTSEGRVYRGPAESPFDVGLVSTSSAAAIDRVLATRVGDHLEILIIDRDRWLWHHDGATWLRVFHFVEDNTAISSKDLFEIGPGHVLASSLSDSRIVRFRDGAFNVEAPDEVPISGFNRVTHVPGFGSLASATLGGLYSDHTGQWAPHMQVSTAVNLGAMGPAMGGLLTASIFGGVELVYPDRKLACGTVDLPGLLRTDYVAPYAGVTLLTGPRREPETKASLFLIQPSVITD